MDPDSEVENLHSRAQSLVDTFKSLEGTRNHIDEAVALCRQALALCQPGHRFRTNSLMRLSTHLSDRYEQFGDLSDIEEAIVLDRAALELCSPGQPDRHLLLNNLGLHLSTRYGRLGKTEDLDEAVTLGRDALVLCPQGDPNYTMMLVNLGKYLGTRYTDISTNIEDLDEAIGLDRDALLLCTPGHRHRLASLNNLAVDLGVRYSRLGAIEDLDEAISLEQDALGLCPPGHPRRSIILNNLAAGFRLRFQKLGLMEDLDKAISHGRDALLLLPPGHPLRFMGQHNMAFNLSTRYGKLGTVEDLNEAIDLERDVLVLCPPGNPARYAILFNLATNLHARYKRLNRIEDLDDAITLGRDGLELCPPGHSDRAESLSNLTSILDTRFRHSFQSKDKDEIFSLYAGLVNTPSMVSSSDLSAAKSWIRMAEHYMHSTTVLAYETTLQFLTNHLTALPALPRHLALIRDISSSLAVDAFSACLRNRSLSKAVELSEQGRGVFLSQLTRLRSPVSNVMASGPEGQKLAEEFTHLTTLIRESFASDLSSADHQHDRICRLNVKLRKVTSDIRKLPGLSHFLLPPPYPDLQHAAACGPVIIVNASQYGCDALVISLGRDPIHVPLEISRDEVRVMTTELYRWTKEAKKMNVAKHLVAVLRPLWNKVVSPIADILQTIHPLQSRIWWCPTSEFILLPLHAAGTYRSGQLKFSDLYISSYTTSLTALIHARRCTPSSDATHAKRFVAIGQASAAGESKLKSIGAELTNISERVHGLATFTRIEGPDTSISRVIESLSDNEWVHFACHGLPNRERPFESAFGLSDGRLTIEQIVQCDLRRPEFAYLSACHTTVGDKECPDEMIHLASAMQFVGFRSVIGTMWAVDDAQTIRITSRFYEHMKDESGRLDHARAAVALHETMKELECEVTFDQRILYVHLGA